MKKYCVLWIFLLTTILVFSSSANAQDYSHIRIVRVSFAEGTVQYHRPGQDWQDASLNLPIQEGFALRTAEGYAEVEFEQGMTVRLGTNSAVQFSVLALVNGGRVTRLTLSQGAAYIDATLRHGDAVVVATAEFAVSLPHAGRYRVDATPSESWVSVFHGKVAVSSASGMSTVSSGRTLHQTSTAAEVAANLPEDDFDKWVERRDDALNAAANETHDVLGGNYEEGFADLYDYGLWDDVPGFGFGWVPYGMGPGWMPFMDGQWMFMGFTGWNWVSAEPWGWLPYHFGSWVDAPGIGWAWLPGGPATWVPANATWVQVNGQLGWLPNTPPTTLARRRLPGATVAPTVILAANGAASIIRPGARVPLSGTGVTMLASAPAPVLTAGTAHAIAPFAASSFVGSSVARNGGPPALRGPNGRSSPFVVARLSAGPRSMLAPHSLPAPAIPRGASSGESRGGVAGGPAFGAAGRGGFGSGEFSGVSRGASAGTGGGAAHAGGSSGASGGHH